MKKLSFIFILCFASTLYASGYQLALVTSHLTSVANHQIGNSEVKSEETRSPMEIKFGKALNNNIYIGAIYDMGKRTVATASVTRTEKRTGYGATIGYDASNYYAHLSYFLAGEYDFDNETVFKEGSGLLFDFGWKIKFSSINIVPQISYRSVSYKIRDRNGTEADIDSSDFGGITPKIGAMYEF